MPKVPQPTGFKIPLIKNTFFDEAATKKALNNFITDAKMLSFGVQCQAFEVAFAKYQKRDHCVFVNSGSSANLALIQALLNLGRLKPGDKVGFSALTWSTNVMPLIQLGLQPVPIDVELDTLNISSRTIKNVSTKHKLKAIFITHLLGLCDDLEVIKSWCDERSILLLEDTCEALGSVYQGNKLGNFGLAGTFSFYVGHHLSTIEGGMVVTDDEELATMLRIVRAHGWDRNLAKNKQTRIRKKYQVNESFYSRYTFYDLGYNFRPTEIAGFLGKNQLKFADRIVRTRADQFSLIASQVYRQTGKYYPIRSDHLDLYSCFAVPIVCRSQKIRDELVASCAGVVETRPIVGGDMTQQPFYKKYVPEKWWLPADSTAALIHTQGLYFANNPDLTQSDITNLVQIFTSKT